MEMAVDIFFSVCRFCVMLVSEMKREVKKKEKGVFISLSVFVRAAKIS